LRGWFPLTVVAVFNGVNGYQPVTTDPTYVADGIPNAPLGPNVGIPSIFGFDINKGRVPLPNAAETGYPAANQLMRRGYIQSWNLIVEHKIPGRDGRVDWIRREQIRQRLRFPQHQHGGNTRCRCQWATALRQIRAHRVDPVVGWYVG
jgi:hypothetical protein